MHTVAKAFAWVLNVYNPWENLNSPQEWLLLTLDFPWFVALFQATQCKPTFGPLCTLVMSDTYALLFLIVNSVSVPLPFVIHEISTHKSHINTLHHYFGIPLLQLWHEKNVNGPLRSVFTDCNSVLLTLDIQDEKGKQKTLGKSCETSFTVY